MLGTERTTVGRWAAALALGGLVAVAACGGGDAATDETAGATAGIGAAPGDTLGAAAPGTAGAMTDAQILARLGVANGAEIAASRLAQPKERNQQVEDFARDMIAEHQAMQGQADSLAMRAGLAPSPVEGDTLQRSLDGARERLQEQAAGVEFDRLYMDLQVASHEATLALLNEARTAAQHADLRALVDEAIPKVQQHLDRSRQIRGALGGG